MADVHEYPVPRLDPCNSPGSAGRVSDHVVLRRAVQMVRAPCPRCGSSVSSFQPHVNRQSSILLTAAARPPGPPSHHPVASSMAWAHKKYVRLQDIASKVTIPTMSALCKDVSSDFTRCTCASPIPRMWRHLSWGRGPAQSQAARCAPCYHSRSSLARLSLLGIVMADYRNTRRPLCSSA